MKKRTDKQRLDFLEREYGDLSVAICERMGWEGSQCVCPKTNREAIDAAMDRENGK